MGNFVVHHGTPYSERPALNYTITSTFNVYCEMSIRGMLCLLRWLICGLDGRGMSSLEIRGKVLKVGTGLSDDRRTEMTQSSCCTDDEDLEDGEMRFLTLRGCRGARSSQMLISRISLG